NPKTFDTWKAYDDRRKSFDNVTLLNNLTSHDEVFPHNDVWRLAYAYAQTAALDGIPMLMYGQEGGAQNSASGYAASTTNFGSINAANNFAKYESNFGKNIPNFKVYNHMSSIWTNRTSDEWRLQEFYGRMNRARLNARALMSQNVYYLDKKQFGGGYDDKIFAVGKVQNLGQTAGGTNSVVFAFVNNNHWVNTNASATYDLNAKVPGTDLNYFGIDRGRNYNVRDLLADNSNSFVWSTNRSGADLIDNGLFVGLPNTNTGTGSYQAQYLLLVDRSPTLLSFVPPQFGTYNTIVTLNATASPSAPVTYSLVSGDTNKVTLNGNQLTINSGTGSVTVRATVANSADREGATSDATITFQKASQTITFVLNPASVAAGTSVPLTASSTSTLPVSYVSSASGVATVNNAGSAVNALSAGQATITASQAGNDNYLAATSVGQVLTVTGDTFESLFGAGNENTDVDGDGISALAEYALNGTTNTDDVGKLPQVEDGALLTISAVVRTNDPRLAVYAVSSPNLSVSWSESRITGTPHSNTNNVPVGFQRQRFFYDATQSTNNQGFIRMRFDLQPPNNP
ncbi:MAG: hypothetical protein ACKPBV_20205, partial [Sphaerospermopsis kisseleviana]